MLNASDKTQILLLCKHFIFRPSPFHIPPIMIQYTDLDKVQTYKTQLDPPRQGHLSTLSKLLFPTSVQK